MSFANTRWHGHRYRLRALLQTGTGNGHRRQNHISESSSQSRIRATSRTGIGIIASNTNATARTRTLPPEQTYDGLVLRFIYTTWILFSARQDECSFRNQFQFTSIENCCIYIYDWIADRVDQLKGTFFDRKRKRKVIDQQVYFCFFDSQVEWKLPID